VHYLSANVYPYFCVPNTIVGFFTSPFMVSSPHCIAMRWIITKSGDMVCMMWMVLGNAILLQIDLITTLANQLDNTNEK
jgi:hypothetical protein